jgi:tetratricopeptide (TPR) repeat protein
VSIEMASLIAGVAAVTVPIVLWRLDRRSAKGKQPRLELVTEGRYSRASFGDLEAGLPEPIREFTVELEPRPLEYLAPAPDSPKFRSELLFVAALRNRGGSVAVSPTVRISGPRSLQLWVVGTSNWDTGVDESGRPYLLYLDKGRPILPGMAERIEGIVAMDFPRRRAAYQFQVEISCASGKWRDAFRVRVTTSHLTPAELANEQGIAAFQSGKMHLADRLFRAALASKRDSSAVWFNSGTALIHLGRYERAYRQLSKAKALAPDKGIIRGNLAAVALLLGKYDEALTLASSALALNGENWTDLKNLLRDYEGLGDADGVKEIHARMDRF